MKSVFFVSLLFIGLALCESMTVEEVVEIITHGRVVDLTHTFGDDTPVWAGFAGVPSSDLMWWYDNITRHPTDGTGFFAEWMCHPGQDGTHVDPPAHFVPGKRTMDQIPIRQMVAPLVVLDIHSQVATNPDYCVTMDDVADWEAEHGEIPEGAFVVLRTDWYNRWPSMQQMENIDAAGVSHTPGWTAEVLEYLYEEVGIVASGHETLDTDPGFYTSTVGEWPLEDYILRNNHYQIEVMANLDQPDEDGCLAVVMFPKVVQGSGFPARVIAVCKAADQRKSQFKKAVMQMLRGDIYDLSETYNEDIPHWVGFPPATRETLYYYQDDGTVQASLGYGFFAQKYCHPGQWSTHCDPPAHFHAGMTTVDQIPAAQMVSPLVIIDVSAKSAANNDYVITMQDILDYEAEHGQIPAGAFVAMRTDWSLRWPDATLIANRDASGVQHYPGWSMDVLQFLYTVRHINANGHETTDTDPGTSATFDDFSCESYVLSQDHFQIELMAGLNQPKEAGCVVFTGWPKRLDGSGFSARVIAVCPLGKHHHCHGHGHGHN